MINNFHLCNVLWETISTICEAVAPEDNPKLKYSMNAWMLAVIKQIELISANEINFLLC